jgi:phosphatidylinositol phospholipase C delta
VEEVINRRHHLTRYSRHSLNLDDFFHFLLYDDLNGPITSQVTPLPNSVAKCIWHVYEI